MTYKRTRLIYQVVFLTLFSFLIFATTEGLLKVYPVNLFLNMSFLSGLSTIISQHHLGTGMIIGVVIAGLTLFLGRFFCAWICPMGTCQHFASFIFTNPDKKTRYLQNSFRNSQKIKYIVLIAFLISAFFGIVLAGYFDPLALITRFSVTVVTPFLNMLSHRAVSHTVAFQATVITGFIFIGAFIANVYRPRFWCRTICPLGALFALFSIRPLFHMVRDREKCTNCGLCHEYCQGACEIDKDFIPAECVMCMNCIDICPTRAIDFGFVPSSKCLSDKTNVKQAIPLTRREFLVSGLIGFASISILRNYKNVYGRGYEKRIRPPGSMPEEHFLARCMRCGECMKVCPTNVIQPAVTETDIEGLWTPVLKMQYGYCEYDCTLCSQVCPTGAIKRITIEEKHEKGYANIGMAFVDRGRCLPWSYGRTCLVCQEVCPVSPKAIYHVEEKFITDNGKALRLLMPYVNPELCIGCGYCEFNCPVQDLPAIRVTSIGEFRSTSRRLIL